MDNKTIHDLAIAYAQAKLLKEQSKPGYDLDNTNEEIRNFLHSYHLASLHLPEEDKAIDPSTLC
jgi:hypothetical protein